jgi:hypothetical protein
LSSSSSLLSSSMFNLLVNLPKSFISMLHCSVLEFPFGFYSFNFCTKIPHLFDHMSTFSFKFLNILTMDFFKVLLILISILFLRLFLLISEVISWLWITPFSRFHMEIFTFPLKNVKFYFRRQLSC